MRDLQSKQDGKNQPTPKNCTNINQGIQHLVKLLRHSFCLSHQETDPGCTYSSQSMKKAPYVSIYLLVGNTPESWPGERGDARGESLGIASGPVYLAPRFVHTRTDRTARPQGDPGGPGPPPPHPHQPLYFFSNPQPL